MRKKGTYENNNIFSKIRNPQSVKILIFVNQQVSIKDFSFMSRCQNLVRLDLSHNNISTFPNRFSFECMPHLRVLLLHWNQLLRFSDLKVVMQTNSLEYLTLFSNPLVVTNTKSRHFILNQMPNLKLFDENIVIEEERSSFILPSSEITSCSEETLMKYPLIDLSEVTSTKEYMTKTREERSQYMGRWLKCNPLIRLQRWVRRMLFLKLKRERRITTERVKMEKKKKSLESNHITEIIDSDSLAIQINEQQNSQLQEEDIEIQPKLIKSPEMKIESLMRCNHSFWTQTIHHLGLEESKWIIISKQFFEFIQNNNPSVLYSLTNHKCKNYRFIRMNQQVPNGKTLLSYLTWSCMKAIVIKPSRQISKLRIIKIKPIDYQVRLKSKLTREQITKSNIKSLQLNDLEESYRQNSVELRGKTKDLINFIRYCLQARAQGKIQFPIYCPKILQRVASALKIQTFWRGYKVRQQVKTTSTLTMHRAANHIQRWLRNLSFHHRHKFLKYIWDDLVDQPTYRLVLHEKLYMAISRLSVQVKNLFKLPLQESEIVIEKGNLHLVNSQNCRPILPSYFSIPQDSLVIESQSPTQYLSSTYAILHTGAKKVFTSIHSQTKFIVFEYPSQQILKQRKLLLALKTYNCKDHVYFQCVSALKTQKLEQYQRKISRVYKVRIQKEESTSKGKLFEPETKGIFIGDISPYEIMSRKKMQLKFMAGTRVYQKTYECLWKSLHLTKLSKAQSSIISKNLLRKSNDGSHYSKALSLATSIEPSPRDIQTSLNSISVALARTIQKNSPSQNVITQYLSAIASSNTVAHSSSVAPTKSYGRYSSIQQTMTMQTGTIEQPTYNRQISRSQISRSQSIELEMEHLHNKRLQIMKSKQEKLHLKSVRLTKKQEELKNLRISDGKEKINIASEFEKKKIQQEKMIALQHDKVYERTHQFKDRQQEKQFQTDFVTRGNYAIKNDLIQKIRSVNQDMKSPKMVFKRKHYTNTTDAANSLHIMKERLKQMPIKTKQTTEQNRYQVDTEILKESEIYNEEYAELLQRQQSFSLKSKQKRDRRQIIHSVFPEEFYPLHQEYENHDDKFSLPRIGRI